MNIILLNPYDPGVVGAAGSIHPPMGLLYIASVLERTGHRVIVVDANAMRLTPDRFIRKYIRPGTDCVGLSINAYQHKAAADICRKIRIISPEIKLIAGGPMPSNMPDFWINETDCVVAGEAEDSIAEIIRCFETGDFSEQPGNVIYRDLSGNVHRPGRLRSPDTDISRLPYPAHHLLVPSLPGYLLRSRTFKPYAAPVFTSRGCEHSCSFCDRSVSGRFRKRDPADAVDEILWLRDSFGVHQIDIEDDGFGCDPEHAREFLRMKAERAPDVVICCDGGLRADAVTESLVRELKRANCVKVGIGIESAEDAVLRKNGKNVPLDKMAWIVDMFRREGIIVHGFFILGLPGDTPESMQKTIAWAKKINPHFANFSTAVPFPGTRMLEDVKNNGNLLCEPEKGLRFGYSAGKAAFEYPGFSRTDLEKAFRKAFRDFYLNPGKLLEYAASSRSLFDLSWRISVGFGVLKNIAGF